MSDVNKKILIKKSKEVTEHQNKLAINEDYILTKKIKSKNITIENINEKNLDEFKRVTNVFHENYFETYPHMKEFIKTN